MEQKYNPLLRHGFQEVAPSGSNPHPVCAVGTIATLTATYANGTTGIGATLTNSGVQAALVIDGVAVVVNDRILVKDQTAALQNGIYVVTNVGSISTNWILTRALDMDTSKEVKSGDNVFVIGGATNALTMWVQTEVGVTVGTDDILFLTSGGSQFDLTQVFDFTNSYLNDFSVNASGDIIAYPQSIDTARRGIFFLPFVKSVEWTYNTRVANWAILGGLKALYTAISTLYSFPLAADFASGSAFTVVMPTPLVDFTTFTRFKLTFDELGDSKYRLYGKLSGAFQLLYPPFDATTTELLPLSGFHVNNQLGISIDGAFSTTTGIAMGNVYINDLPITSYL